MNESRVTQPEALREAIDNMRTILAGHKAIYRSTLDDAMHKIDAALQAQGALQAQEPGALSERKVGWFSYSTEGAAIGATPEPAHTDHLSRHWDRTCPGCIAEADGFWAHREDVERFKRGSEGPLYVARGKPDDAGDWIALAGPASIGGPSDSPSGEGPARSALLLVLGAVRDYLPPDGISTQAAMSRIISAVDPWPIPGDKP